MEYDRRQAFHGVSREHDAWLSRRENLPSWPLLLTKQVSKLMSQNCCVPIHSIEIVLLVSFTFRNYEVGQFVACDPRSGGTVKVRKERVPTRIR